MEEGIDVNKLFASQEVRDIAIEYKGEKWTFGVRELTWREKGMCVTEATKIDIGGKRKGKKTNFVRMDMPSYNIAYMMKAIVNAPFPVNMASFIKLDEEFGDLLVDAIVDPEGMAEDDEKNSDGISEA